MRLDGMEDCRDVGLECYVDSVRRILHIIFLRFTTISLGLSVFTECDYYSLEL